MPDSDLKVHEDLKVDTSHGDHERFAHYVDKNDMMNAAVFGTPIKALCGKVWVPSRDPQKFPVCPECKEIYESLPPGDGDDDRVVAAAARVSRIRSESWSSCSSRLAESCLRRVFSRCQA